MGEVDGQPSQPGEFDEFSGCLGKERCLTRLDVGNVRLAATQAGSKHLLGHAKTLADALEVVHAQL